ncbi:TetR/AcrR family transcriptional regulator [Shewanella surugensis]|uniref:TetR/AcrR family transcriptional regulator n=1 Tax=Shewanella surugensis TaxID=212020 RepID=A0ABT0LHZ1_9GAMM|nr:TetR/AcrR family transcriptional regulator [Shewanella surugensis]MCL1127194.1 TetR/AcrR family transcriptional regulator [Shewanella surugensis]
MSSTVERIIENAESQIRTGGYNAFSFRAIAKAIGIQSASIHYHFPTKPDLAIAVANRYTQRFIQQLDVIKNNNAHPKERLAPYIDLFRHAIKIDKKMCLCGILASETDALPELLQLEVKRFFELNLQWISAHLLTEEKNATAQASQLLASLEGSLLISKIMKSDEVFNMVSNQLLN